MKQKPSRSPRAALLLALPLALSACGAGKHFNRDPQISDLVVNPQTIPEVARVQVPLPLPEIEPPEYRASRASLWSPRADSLFEDRRADEVGDLLTVVIQIDDEAQLKNATDRSRGGQSNLGFPKLFGYGTQIDKILPGVSPEDLPTGDLVDITSQLKANGSGSIDRNEQINLKLAALVVQKLPNGALVIAGRQEVKVNQELRELRMAGIIRPEDIRNDNTIPYEKVAEARIAYGGQGTLSHQQTRSYGEDALDVILPY